MFSKKHQLKQAVTDLVSFREDDHFGYLITSIFGAEMHPSKKTEICIVGAGPAGSFAALFLAKYGIPCTLFDKAKFPRDKICGDGISGWVLTIMNELDKNLLKRLAEQPFILYSHGIRIVAPNHKYLDIPFTDNGQFEPGIPPGFTGRRLDFDQFLIDEVRTKDDIEFRENTEIVGFEKSDDKIILVSDSGEKTEARLVIFANGSGSSFSKDPGGMVKTKKNTMTGIKAYYEGITGFHDQNYVELHFFKDLLPGYFWIFPLPGGIANVGVGLDQHRISKRKLNLKDVMLSAIENLPYLKERFSNARLISKIQAYHLPLWDKKRKLSGDHFMLVGDAASLVDPVTGEGVGHAAISGMYAAEQARRSIELKDFSASCLAQYDKSLYNRIGNELYISSRIPRFIRFPWLFNMMVNKGLKSKTLQGRLSQAMTDLDVRKRLKEPSLYLKVLLGK
jgi:geranylgeranyl reductase family protein